MLFDPTPKNAFEATQPMEHHVERDHMRRSMQAMSTWIIVGAAVLVLILAALL